MLVVRAWLVGIEFPIHMNMDRNVENIWILIERILRTVAWYRDSVMIVLLQHGQRSIP